MVFDGVCRLPPKKQKNICNNTSGGILWCPPFSRSCCWWGWRPMSAPWQLGRSLHSEAQASSLQSWEPHSSVTSKFNAGPSINQRIGFQGKSSGNHGISREIWRCSVRFSLNQSIESLEMSSHGLPDRPARSARSSSLHLWKPEMKATHWIGI